MTHIPLQLRVGNRRCAVVGGGVVATRRVLRLLTHGADVVVVAPQVSEAIEELADRGALELRRRPVEDADLDGAFLVVLCTDDPGLHDRLVGSSAAAFVTRADDAGGDLSWMAERSFGPLRLAVGTDGRAPVVGAWAADRLVEGASRVLDADEATIEALVDLVEEVRRESAATVEPDGPGTAKRSGESRSGLDWRSALDRSMLEMIRSGRRAEAKERLKACRSSS
jgi:siroheme synthase-like protein